MEEEDFAKESQAGGANDYDDDELIEFEVDSEAVHNTNANVRATRPSISLEKYDDHEGEIPRERTSAIRFQGKGMTILFEDNFTNFVNCSRPNDNR